MIEARIDSGIEIVMISVLRQLPRNSRIMSPVSAAAITRLADHAGDGGAHEDRLVAEVDLEVLRQRGARSAAGAA